MVMRRERPVHQSSAKRHLATDNNSWKTSIPIEESCLCPACNMRLLNCSINNQIFQGDQHDNYLQNQKFADRTDILQGNSSLAEV